LTDELQVGFVNQRGWLKRMALSFPVHVLRGNRSQFGVNIRKQLLFGMVIPWFEFLQELSDPRRSVRFRGHPTHQSLRTKHDGIVAPATAQVKVDGVRATVRPGMSHRRPEYPVAVHPKRRNLTCRHQSPQEVFKGVVGKAEDLAEIVSEYSRSSGLGNQ
jgi:hypothetical protein